MLIFVRHKINNEYFTIYRRDKQKFLNLKYFFEPEPFNFELIEDTDKIKEILEEKFTSKNRGEEYNAETPSVTQLSYKLYPMNIDKEKFLIKWLNNNVVTTESEKTTQNILNLGTVTHKILELYLCDKDSRLKDKPIIGQLKNSGKNTDSLIINKITKDLKKYIYQAFEDEEIVHKVVNLEELKSEIINKALKTLPNFILKELINLDLIYSEIFLSVPDYIQGSVDLVGYKDNKFSIIDFKTTSGTDKKTGKPKFKTKSQLEPYSRQLAIYNELLKRTDMSHLSDKDLPDFYIYQIHLIGNSYKKFEIPKQMVKHSAKEVNKIIDWYWSIRNGTQYIEPQEEELEFLTL